MNRTATIAAALLGALAATPALAHTGVGPTHGLGAGFLHPLAGLDHLLAMVAIGVLAAQQGGRSRWALPAIFVAMMIVGGGVALAGIGLPLVEIGIVGSLLLLGGLIALGRKLATPVALLLAGGVAVFHGHAHGAEIPALASALPYFLGFAAVSVALHGLGFAATRAVERLAASEATSAIRTGGAAIAATGALLLVS